MQNISLKWLEIVRTVLQMPKPAVVYLLGMSDTGKSTLARYLYNEMARSFSVAYLDADPGQSSIGPPATLGLKIKHKPSGKEEERLKYVGSVTPHRNQLAHYRAIMELKNAAVEAGAEVVLVDSSGYAAGWEAGDFQLAVLKGLNPNLVLAIQKSDELKPLLQRIRMETRIATVALETSESVQPRDWDTRQKRRERLFSEYFADCNFETCNWQNWLIWGDWSGSYQFDACEGTLAGLMDRRGGLLGLAIVKNIDFEMKSIEMATPCNQPEEVALLELSNLWLHLDGRHGPLHERLPDTH